MQCAFHYLRLEGGSSNQIVCVSIEMSEVSSQQPNISWPKVSLIYQLESVMTAFLIVKKAVFGQRPLERLLRFQMSQQ